MKARRQALFLIEYPIHCLAQIPRYKISDKFALPKYFLAISRAHQNTLQASALAGLHVALAITDYKATQLHLKIPCRFIQHARPRLAAVTLVLRRMRAEVKRIDVTAVFLQMRL